MATFIFTNNINTTLAGGISSASTSLTLSSTQNLPASVPAGSYMVLTLNDRATRTNYEIVYVTAISGATLTVLRGQEGTAAKAWLTGDYAFSGPTAGQMASFMQGTSTGVTPGTYGNSTTVPQITVNAQGLVSGVTNVPIAFPITSFNGRAGAIVLNSGDVTSALGFNPVNKAGDTMTGALTVTGGRITATGTSGAGSYPAVDAYTGVGRVVIGNYTNSLGTVVNGIQSITNDNTNRAELNIVGSTIRLSPVNSQVVSEGNIDISTNVGHLNFGVGFGAHAIQSVNVANNAYIDLLVYCKNFNINVNSGSMAVNGAFSCTTFNASASDSRIKKDFLLFEPRPIHRSVPFLSYNRRDMELRGLGPVAQDIESFDPRYLGSPIPISVGGEVIDALTIDKSGLAYEQAMWAGFEIDRLRARVTELELAVHGGN